MYKLEKKEIKGLSPFFIKNAEKDKLDLSIEGNQYQEVREGYNLLNSTLEDTEINGISVKYNTDGSVTLNGTATTVTAIQVSNNSIELENTDYTYFLKGKTQDFNFYVKQSTGTNHTLLETSSLSEKIVKNLGAITIIGAYLYVQKDIVLNNVTVYPMIYKGTEEKEYEQYGAMPSVEYPSKIETVGDNINILPNEATSQIEGNLEWTVNSDGSVHVVGTASSNALFLKKGTNNTEEVFRFKANKIYKNVGNVDIIYRKINGNYARKLKGEIFSYGEDEVINQLYLQVPSGQTVDETYYPKIVEYYEGIDESYSPYNMGSVKITKVNKNMFILPASNLLGIEVAPQEDGAYKLNGTSTTSWAYRNGEYFWISPGEYTIFAENLEELISAVFGIRTEDNSWKAEINTGIKEYTFTVTEKMKVRPYFTCLSSAVFNNNTVKVQLEKDIKTDWVKHEEESCILPIQQEMLDGDYFDLERGKEVHHFHKYMSTSADNWILTSDSPNRFRFDTNITTQNNALNNTNQYCSHSNICSHWASPDKSFQVRRGSIYFKTTDFSTAEEFNQFVTEQEQAGTPLTFWYECEEYELDLTEEQKQILNSIETFDGVNNIFFDNSIAKATIKYTPKLTDEIKKAFTESAVYSEIKLEDGKILTESDYIKSVKFYDTKFVPDNGIIGQAVMKQVDLQINNENQNLQLEDKEYELFLSTYYNEEKYSIKYGKFIIQKLEDENTTDNSELTSFDYMVKANQKYVDQMQYPCKLRELTQNICDQLGLVLQKEEFRNEDFIVENNQFVENETYRDVLKAIAMSAFSWVRIDENNILKLDFNPNINTIEVLDYDDYYNLNKNEKVYGPVNRIVLRDSQIEGENVTIQDEESINKNGLHELVISDNPFAYTEEKRTQLINAGKELYGFEYFPVNSMNTKGFIWLNCTDKIRIKNMQDKFIDTFVFDHTIEYEGTVQDEIASPALTETETKYIYTPEMQQKIQKTERIVDKQNQTITDIVTKTDGNTEKISEHTQTLNTIKDTLKSITTTVSNTVKEVKVLYALSNSQTEPPTEGWSVVAPEWQEGKYMWQKTVTTFSDDTQEESQATCIQGAAGKNGIDGKDGQDGINGTNGKDGKDGTDGLGIKSIETQYYLSTSETETTGGTWKSTQDKWSKGKYIWTRSKITWSDESVTYSSPVVAEGLNSANENADSANEGTKEVTTKMSEVEKTVEGITQTVNQTTERLNNDYSTTEQMNSAIEQKADSITSSVTESIDNIQVGGTNLIPNSAPYNLENWNNNNTTSIELTLQDEETAPYGKALRIRTLNQLTAVGGCYIIPTPRTLEANKEYCFSIWLRATANTTVTVGYAKGGQTTFNVTTEYQKFTHKFTALAPTSTSHGFVVNVPAGVTAGRQVYFHSVKLEEGNKITAWSPAPEDDVKGVELGTKIEQNSKSVQIAWNQLSQSIKFEGDNNDATMSFYDDNTKFGEMGVNTVDNNRYISFATLLDYGQSMSDGMAWGIQTTSDNKFWPILFIKDFFMANKNAGNFGGQLVLNFCDLVLGSGAIKAENIRIGADDTTKGIYFENTETGDILLSIYPDSSVSDARINILDKISFFKNVGGTNTFKVGLEGANSCVLTDDGYASFRNFYSTQGGSIVGNLHVDGNVYADNISSDKRLKDNIKDSNTNALDIINKIKHRQFEMKKNGIRYNTGYIAQEMEEIDKNFVLKREKTDKSDEQYYINELPILATTTKAIQELSQKVEQLQKKIEELENKIKEK